MTDWWLNELAYAGDEHLDPEYVGQYTRKAGYDPAEDVVTLKAHGLSPDSSLLDYGSGDGTFALAAAPHCHRVIAIDVSPAMCELLSQKAVAAGVRNIEVVNAGFLSYAHDGEPSDFAFTRNALHQLPDFWKALALERVFRALRPGGILLLRDLVFDFDARDARERIDAWMAGAVTDPAIGFTAQEFADHVQREFSTYSWVLEPMLERAGFEIIERHYRKSVYASYTCRRADR